MIEYLQENFLIHANGFITHSLLGIIAGVLFSINKKIQTYGEEICETLDKIDGNTRP